MSNVAKDCLFLLLFLCSGCWSYLYCCGVLVAEIVVSVGFDGAGMGIGGVKGETKEISLYALPLLLLYNLVMLSVLLAWHSFLRWFLFAVNFF